MSDAQPIRRKGITLGVPRRMSPEELAAEKTRIIEENFPQHRTLHLKPKDEIIIPIERVEIVVTEEVLLATAHHVAQDTSKESGGFLLGNRYVCPNTNRQYIVIDQLMKADYTEGTQVSLTFTTDSWAQLNNRLEGKYLGKNLVGWYHSHPGMGIFLSNYDLDIHKNRFSNDFQVALVLDPIKHEGGFFAWIDGNVNPREKVDFYELLEGDSRETVTAWTNYTAEDPKTGAPAKLKPVNTQNSDGNPLAVPAASSRNQTVSTKPGGLLSNPFALIGGVAVLALLLLGSLFAGYFIWKKFASGNTVENNSNTANSNNNKVLISKNIRISDDLKGWVASDKKMTVDMQIKGVGSSDVIEEVKKNMTVEINEQPTTLTSEEVNGILKVRAVAILPDNVAEAFNSGNQQDFVLRIEMSYGEDVVAKRINTTFKKGTGNAAPSLGDLVVFADSSADRESEDTPVRKKTPAPQRQTETQNNDKDRQKTQSQTQSQQIEKPKENQQPAKANPTKKPADKSTPKPKNNGIIDEACQRMGTC